MSDEQKKGAVVFTLVPEEKWSEHDRQEMEYAKACVKDGVIYGDGIPKAGEPVSPKRQMQKIKVLIGPKVKSFVTETEIPEIAARGGSRAIAVYPEDTPLGPVREEDIVGMLAQQRPFLIPRAHLEWWMELLASAGHPVRAVLASQDHEDREEVVHAGIAKVPPQVAALLKKILEESVKSKPGGMDMLIDMLPPPMKGDDDKEKGH